MLSRAQRSLLLVSVLLIGLALSAQGWAGDCPDLLNHSFPGLKTGERQNLCQFRGKVILVVNTASYCGYTNQYGGLEKLNRKYMESGLVVLGFPSNDFGGQEPGNSKQIADFCRLTYSVEFPMLAKSHVVGEQRNAFYAELERRTGKKPSWNFHKYLIDHTGTRVMSFESAVAPDDKRLLKSLHELLDARKKTIRMI
jgi:glutathione peroxidase